MSFAEVYGIYGSGYFPETFPIPFYKGSYGGKPQTVNTVNLTSAARPGRTPVLTLPLPQLTDAKLNKSGNPLESPRLLEQTKKRFPDYIAGIPRRYRADKELI